MLKLVIILLFAAFSCSFTSKRLDRVCGSGDGKIYLDLGEGGIITDKNVTFPVHPAKNNSFRDASRRMYCSMEIETCPSCLITLKFRYLDLRDNCEKRALFDRTNCRCNYIWIAETSYEGVSGTPFCGYWNSGSSFGKKELSYRSSTKAVQITFFYMHGAAHEFVIQYTSERNRKFFFGSPQGFPASDLIDGIFLSPFFPALYPRDLVSEYIISCLKYSHPSIRNASKIIGDSCKIRLVFTDFHLASSSVMEFFDENQRRIGKVTGSSFRPPIIMTNSSLLLIRFSANGGRSLGFKGTFSFVPGNYHTPLLEPNTNCGGLVEDSAGAITMMSMVPSGIKPFDCIWLIRPPDNIYNLTGELYLKVNVFADFAGYAELQIREGLTSESPLLEKILQSPAGNTKEHVTSISSGFYINLRAAFEPASILGITFTSFHCNKCYNGLEFLCHNLRCIPGKVVCDGFDHCGDNSDETELCFKDWSRSAESSRYSNLTPNYFFPKVEHYSELKRATLVFIVGSLGLILFLTVLIILLYRIGTRSQQQAQFQNRLQTIIEFLDDAEIEEIIEDEPPLYEAPPDYEAPIKETSKTSKKCRLRELKGQITEARSREGKQTGTLPETFKYGPSEELSEVKLDAIADCGCCSSQFQEPNGKQRLSDSPPPPYSEHDSIAVNCGPYQPTQVSIDFQADLSPVHVADVVSSENEAQSAVAVVLPEELMNPEEKLDVSLGQD